MYSHQGTDLPGKIAKHSQDQLIAERMNISLSPFLPENFWSRETDLAVPSCVSLLILHTQAQFGACSRDSSSFLRRRSSFYTAIRHRVSPEFIGSYNLMPMTLTAESPSAQGQQSSRSFSSINEFCLISRSHDGSVNVHLSFPTPTIIGILCSGRRL